MEKRPADFETRFEITPSMIDAGKVVIIKAMGHAIGR